MKVKLRFFAIYREMAGAKEAELELEKEATVAQLLERLSQKFPQITINRAATLVAVNREYVDADFALTDGDEVALIPPVSGGGWVHITESPISPQKIAAELRKETHGAVVSFEGIVRGLEQGHQVLYLEYDAYPEMAEEKLREITEEIRHRWNIEDVVIFHRIGRLEVGECSLVIVVASPHRREAFAACQYAVDRIKEIVPIWKKEVWEDGEVWVGWQSTEAAGLSKEPH